MVKKVIVLGGGSAGFMAALALKTRLAGLGVLLIRSRDIGIIGVGEGSTPPLTQFLHSYLKVAPKQFFEVARPTWKLGLRFIWGPLPGFNYSFFAPSIEARPEPALRKPMGFYCTDDIDYLDPVSARMSHDTLFAQSGGAPVFDAHYAYHFENENFVRYLEQSATAAGVEIRQDTVANVRQDDAGITALDLASGRSETADLYVDCSGFHSLLLDKTFNEPFESYAKSLFCTRAIVGGWERGPGAEAVIKPYTTCQTMNAGWAWQIEHENRINRGYVYCPEFVGDDEAEREFCASNPKLDRTRVVQFTSGRYRRAWVKNVIAIGNATGFVEPLEATALGVIAQQTRALTETLAMSDCRPRPSQVDLFNRLHGMFWDCIRNFLAIHYKFNTRLDTPFWRHCREKTDLAGGEEIVRFYEENGPDGYWSPTLLDNPHDQFGVTGYFTLLAGMKVPFRRTYEPTAAELEIFRQRRQTYRDMALRCLTVRQVLAAVRSPRANLI